MSNKPLNHAMQHNDTLAGEFREILDLSEIFGNLVAENTPWIYRTDKGPIGGLNNHAAAAALPFDDRAIAVGRTGELQLYKNSGWEWIYKANIISSSPGTLIFISSGGSIFVSYTGSNTLWRSTDQGETFASVYTTTQQPGSVQSMTEDASGNLYLADYGSDATGTGETPTIAKSTDDGATWSTAITVNLAIEYARHCHVIAYDNYRSALVLSGGDASNQYCQYSTDGGATWTAWTQTHQCTEILFTPTAILFASDLSTDRGIYRATSLGGDWELVYTPDISEIPSNNGFIWFGGYERGVLWMAYAGGDKYFVVASVDDGRTWQRILTGDDTGTESFLATRAYYSPQGVPYVIPGMKGGYSTDAGQYSGNTLAWSIYPGTSRLEVNDSTGHEWGDGYSTPILAIVDSEDIAAIPGKLRLSKDYTSPLYLKSIKSIDMNGYSVTGEAEAPADQVTCDFDSTTWTSGTIGVGTIDLAATANPYAGTKHGRLVVASGSGWRGAYLTCKAETMAEGKEYWLDGYCYVDAASLASEVSLMFSGGGCNAEVRINTDLSLKYYYWDSVLGSTNYHQAKLPDGGRVEFTLQKYVRFTVRLYIHDTQGRVSVWLDDVLAADWVGVRTQNSANAKYPADLHVGFKSQVATLTVDWDELKYQSEADPRLTSDGITFA